MSQYKHFSYCERVELARMLHEKATKVAIGQCLGRPRCSIERQIGRNGNKDGTYNPDTAQRRYEARRRRGSILERFLQLQQFVVDQLHENWTPEQIAGWLRNGNEKQLPSISHETIYAWIYSSGQRARKLWKLLPWPILSSCQTALSTGPQDQITDTGQVFHSPTRPAYR